MNIDVRLADGDTDSYIDKKKGDTPTWHAYKVGDDDTLVITKESVGADGAVTEQVGYYRTAQWTSVRESG